MNIRCITVDDEPASRDILRRYIREIPTLTLSGECKDAMEATTLLDGLEIDLIFLDINMPGLSGISLARSMISSPQIIFTTAYPEYAVEGFEINAADYLIKPFSFERFLKAVNRVRERLEKDSQGNAAANTILLRSEKKIYNIKIADIQFIEGCGDYIKVVLPEKSLIVHETIKNFLSLLPGDLFLRVHKSYAVQTGQVEYIEGNIAHISGHAIPISPNIKSQLLERMV